MSYNIFDHEQEIMHCWAVVDSLDLLAEAVLERDLTKDQLASILLGMKELYQLRFERLWEQFEASIKK